MARASKPASIETAVAGDDRPAAPRPPVSLDHPDPTVAALLRERAGYKAKGRPDRAAQVTAELARHGVA